MTARFMINQPALKTALLVSIGIALSGIFRISFHILLILASCTTLLTLIFISLKRDTFLQWFIPITLIILGGLRYTQVSQLFPENHIIRHIQPDKAVILQGFLIKDPIEKPGRYELTIGTESIIEDTMRISVTGKLRTTVYEGIPENLKYGDQIQITGRLIRPRRRRNPGGFDYRAYLARQDIHVLLRMSRGSEIIKTGQQKGSVLLRELVYPVRRYFLRIIDNTTLGEARSILRALLVGEKGTLDPELRDRFAKAGIIHVLAVSGLHVGFVLLILTVIFGFLRFPYTWRVALVIMGLVFYALLTESKPPVIRAVIMASVYLIGTVLERRANPLNLVGVAALIILLWKPLYLFDIGFQLSFTAILSIIYFYRKLNDIPFIKVVYRKFQHYPLGRYLISLFLVSISAQLGTLPLTAVYFNRIPLLSVFVNLIAIPMVGLVVAFGFVTVLFGLLHPWLAAVYGALNHEILTLFLKMITRIGDMPLAFAFVPTPGILHILIYFSIVLGLLDLYKKSIRRIYAFILLFFLNILVWRAAVRNEASKLTWIQFDVGQGDAAILHMPRNRHILIDGGDRTPYFDNGERVIAPYLRRKGIRKIDAVLITHPHNDHIGGLLYILDNFQADQIITAGTPCESRMAQNLHQMISNKNIPASNINAPDTLSFPGTRLVFLSPDEKQKNQFYGGNLNNQSLVCHLFFGSTRFMFTGDIEKPIEDSLVRQGNPLKSDVLKVAHHGSQTSSSKNFLNTILPDYAVISVGEKNRFNHPSAVILERLRASGIKTLRTDLEGAILFKSNGKSIRRVQWR